VCPQFPVFPPTLRVRELVDFARAHYPRPLGIDDVLERFDLTRLSRRSAGTLSGGEKGRLAAALAFAGDPDLVVLDEPTAGLDLDSRHAVWNEARRLAREGGTVLLTTHHLEEADALASRVVLLARGTVVADGTPDEIKARTGMKRVRVATDLVAGLEGVERAVPVNANGSSWVYTRDPGRLVAQLIERRIDLGELEIGPASLEEAFIALTTEAR